MSLGNMVLQFLNDFIWTYYLSPGYNIVNTLTYGIVLGFVIFKIIPYVQKLLKDFDKWLMIMLIPFILFGSTGRELIDQDIGLYAGNTQFPRNYMFVSPGIYFTMFFLTLSSIAAGLLVQKVAKINYKIVTAALGCVLFFYNLSLILGNLNHLDMFAFVLFYFMISSGFAYVLKYALNLAFLDREYNLLVVLVHLFDASTTFVGVDYIGHVEKHVLPNFFIGLTGTAAVMYVLKLAVLIPAIYYIDDELKDEDFTRKFVKFVIVVLGAGPAIRNSTLIIMG